MIGSIRVDLHSKLPVVQKIHHYHPQISLNVPSSPKTCGVVFCIVSPKVKNHKAGKNIYPRLKAHNSLTHQSHIQYWEDLISAHAPFHSAATSDDKKTFPLLVAAFNKDETQLPQCFYCIFSADKKKSIFIFSLMHCVNFYLMFLAASYWQLRHLRVKAAVPFRFRHCCKTKTLEVK